MGLPNKAGPRRGRARMVASEGRVTPGQSRLGPRHAQNRDTATTCPEFQARWAPRRPPPRWSPSRFAKLRLGAPVASEHRPNPRRWREWGAFLVRAVMVREAGVEPAWVSPLDPKSSASASSATLAQMAARDCAR